MGKESSGGVMAGRGHAALDLSGRDQGSRAKLRTGDLSKAASVVWAAGSRITTQEEVL